MESLKNICRWHLLQYLFMPLLVSVLWWLSLQLYVRIANRGLLSLVRNPHSLTCEAIVSGIIDRRVHEHPELPVCIEVPLVDVDVSSDGTMTMCRQRVLIVDIGSRAVANMRDRLRMARGVESQEQIVACGDFSSDTSSPSYLIDGQLFGQYMFFPIWVRPVKQDVSRR